MSNKDRRNPDEYFDIPKTVKISDRMLEALQLRKEETGVAIGTQMRRAVQDAISVHDSGQSDDQLVEVPLFGEIPGGPAAEIKPELPGQYIRPPFKDLPDDCYALVVKGDSMESEFGISAPDGFYALFAPGVIFPHAIVHVEFSDGQCNHAATLKKYVPKGDGTTEFRPLNSKHKPIVVEDGTYVIKGGFIRAWDGKSQS